MGSSLTTVSSQPAVILALFLALVGVAMALYLTLA